MAKRMFDIGIGKRAPGIVNAIIEIPKGSKNKYELDKKTGLLKLDRVLNAPFHYATEYGIIPETLGEDNDPLDVLVLIDQPTFPGCLIEVRPIAMLETIDGRLRDVKILSVPIGDVFFGKKRDLKDCDKALLDEIALFFQEYKRLQKGNLRVIGWRSAGKARKEILKGMKLFNKTKE